MKINAKSLLTLVKFDRKKNIVFQKLSSHITCLGSSESSPKIIMKHVKIEHRVIAILWKALKNMQTLMFPLARFSCL